VIGLGFHSRIEVVLADGTESTVQLTRAHARQLELKVGDTVFLRRLGEGPAQKVPSARVATADDSDPV
jgi:TOBE domain